MIRCITHPGRSKLVRDKRGIAAMEFVLMLPMLIALLLGAMEISRFVMINQKVQEVGSTVADMVAREKAAAISNATLNDLLLAAAQVMNPYTFGSNGLVIITSVTQTGASSGSNPPKVTWQYSGGGTLAEQSRIGSPGNTANMPVGFAMADKDNVIVTEVFYNFTTLFGTRIIGNQLLYNTAYYKPRLGALTTPPT